MLKSLLATGALVLAAPVLASAPAHADTPGCVSRTEFGAVQEGWRSSRVVEVFDTRGTQVSYRPGGTLEHQTRRYDACPGFLGLITVDFARTAGGTWRVTDKAADRL